MEGFGERERREEAEERKFERETDWGAARYLYIRREKKRSWELKSSGCETRNAPQKLKNRRGIEERRYVVTVVQWINFKKARFECFFNISLTCRPLSTTPYETATPLFRSRRCPTSSLSLFPYFSTCFFFLFLFTYL